MPFCFAPWTNIDISPQGDLMPCCKFDHKSYTYKKQNIITTDIQSYSSCDLLQEIKEDFLNDQWPTGCNRCRIEEENAVESKRQLDYSRWQDHYDSYNLKSKKYLTASIAFGNTCNYKCITCSPSSSSRWYQEYKLIYGQAKKPNHFYKEGFIEDFIAQCDNLIHLDIPGGEPFLSGVGQQQELLDFYIQSGQAKNISIHYTTNVSKFPDQSWWDRWQYFNEIDMQLSIDGVGSRYEYIRFPGNWEACEQNVDRYLAAEHQTDNLRLSVSHTLSAYNVNYLDEFFNWCEQKKLPRPWIGRVHTPAHFRLGVYPDSIKESIVASLRSSKFKDVQIWANLLENSDDTLYFDEFIKKTKAHDEYRQLNFEKTFPEVANLIDKYSNNV